MAVGTGPAFESLLLSSAFLVPRGCLGVVPGGRERPRHHLAPQGAALVKATRALSRMCGILLARAITMVPPGDGRAQISPSAAHESPRGKRPLSPRGKGLRAELLPRSLWGLGLASGSCSPALDYFCNGAAAWGHLIRVCWQLRPEGTLSLLFSASIVQSRAPRWCRWVCAAAEPLLQPRFFCHSP